MLENHMIEDYDYNRIVDYDKYEEKMEYLDEEKFERNDDNE
jgi:hypothetical protein